MISNSELMTRMLDGEVIVDDEKLDREQIINIRLQRE